jgi:hypothetical protein
MKADEADGNAQLARDERAWRRFLAALTGKPRRGKRHKRKEK